MKNMSNNSMSMTMDIWELSKRFFKSILCFGLLGLSLAYFYKVYFPIGLEAKALIEPAQFGPPSPGSPYGPPIQTPVSLSELLKFPSNYVEECRVDGVESVKYSVVKGSNNLIEVVVRGDSKVLMLVCIDKVLQKIVLVQSSYIIPMVKDSEARLAEVNSKIESLKGFVLKARASSNESLWGTYFISRDEIAKLMSERSNLIELLASIETRAAKLAAPIYIAEEKDSRKPMFFVIFFILGIFIGVLVSFARVLYSAK